MQDEISLGDENPPRNTGIRYDKRGPNYGVLSQDIYTVKDLSMTIGVHHTTILEHIKSKRLKALYLGGPAGYRIHREDIINWVRNLSNEE